MTGKIFKKKDYFTSQESLEIMMLLSLKHNLDGVVDGWGARNVISPDESKNLKMARTYLSKFLESLFARTSKEEIKRLNRKMEVNTVRLYDKYQLDALNKKVDAAYEKTVLDSDQYCLFCENIMDVNCKSCTKCSSECELYDLFVDTLAPEPGDNKPNCKYAYDL